MVDLNRATVATPEVLETLHDQYDYHPWNEAQKAAGERIRRSLEAAAAVIIDNAPPGPDRAVALRKLREARMDANSAITHQGRY